jgi:DNA-directed RNA polymerase I subunit RPA49
MVAWLAYSSTAPVESKELLLHSANHATIDYTAVEAKSATSIEKYRKHYVAVFDPATGQLDVTEAKKMIVRPLIRQFQTRRNNDGDNGAVSVGNRAQLTQNFGTKKAKKAMQARAESRLAARPGNAEDALSKAHVNLVPGDDDDDDPKSSTKPQDNKPLPRANLEAEQVQDVYSLSTLVGPDQILKNLSVVYWMQRISAGKPISGRFLFVSNRVEYLTKAHLESPENPELLRHVQVLRFLELLLELHRHVLSLGRPKKIPPEQKWPDNIRADFNTVSYGLLGDLISRFFSTQPFGHRSMTLLKATILALTLHVPPPSFRAGTNLMVAEPTDISTDLASSLPETTELYRQLGCKVVPATEAELARWGLGKFQNKIRDANGDEISLPKPRFAKLSLPLEFPRISQGRRIQRRG